MTRDELVARLEDIRETYTRGGSKNTHMYGWGDRERAHEEVDKALLEYINDPVVTELHDKLCPWYA